MAKIRIYIGDEVFDAHLNKSEAPRTVEKILSILPVEATISSWGDEFYFAIPVEAGLENAVGQVEKGDLAFWPQGNAFCIFFGRTPLTTDEDKIIPASAVNPIGRIQGIERLRSHSGGEPVKITRA